MFCSECGVKAAGKFCFRCGSQLQVPEGATELTINESELTPVDWEHDPRYENIIRVEAVLETIKRLASNSHKGVSGEAFLALYDKVVKSPVALEDLVAIAQPLYESWGIHTGKQRTEMINSPIGRSIAQTLCSFAKTRSALSTSRTM